ncbi:HEPN domain-containing protein [Pantoea ananatis]|uniref:HEPN domain-containing protein n=1 Tax=Pantoea ananas TaxID=553 RepID=UPI000CEB6D14|nr:HEPN domain-containing protein [Pantoea ananatis]AVG78426.1 hypothetical protein B9Q16_21415 [Pantoea ananatis]
MPSKKLDSQYLTVEIEDEELIDIPCDVEVEDDQHWNKITITSTDTRILKLQNVKFIDAKLSSSQNDKERNKLTLIKEAYLGAHSVSFSMTNIFKFQLRPKSVIVSYKYPHLTSGRKKEITYLINKSPMFAPGVYADFNKNGNVTHTKGKALEILTPAGVKIKSDILFTFSSKKGHTELDQYQTLQASIIKSKNVNEEIEKNITPHVKNILLLMSFLQYAKTNYLSYQIRGGDMLEIHYNSGQFRSEDVQDDYLNVLIERQFLDDFFQTCLRNFHGSPYHKELKNAINSIVNSRKGYVELSFLAYFQAFESLVLCYKRNNNIENILEKSVFIKVKRAIEKELSQVLEHDKEKRASIKAKLNELNRYSLKESVSFFFESHNIDISGVWPLFDDKNSGVTGLTTIRNVLIHGDLIPNEYFESIVVAMEHLRILLARCVFCILGWELSQTNINTNHLAKIHNFFQQDILESAMKKINTYFLIKKDQLSN